MSPAGFPATRAEVAAAVVRVLSSRGPLSEVALLSELRTEGVDLGRDPEATLGEVLEGNWAPLALPLRDGRLAWLPALLDGRVFTHRLSACEAAHDVVDTRLDLAPVSMLDEADDGRRVAAGGSVQPYLTGFDDDLLAERGVPLGDAPSEGWLLPEGTFAALGATEGSWLGVGVRADGLTLAVVVDGVLADGASVSAALAEVMSEAGEPELLDIAVWSACARHDELFRLPVAPLGELLAAAGLPVDGDEVGPPGFDFATWRVERHIESIASTHGLGDDAAVAVLALSKLYEDVAELFDAAAAAEHDGPEAAAAFYEEHISPAANATASAGQDDPERRTVLETLAFLGDPGVARALLVETVGPDRGGAAALGLFAETLEPQAPPASRAGLRWLRAKAEERLGHTVKAEATLQDVLGLDSGWRPALEDLARYASDRGDASRGLALLRRAGVGPQDPMVRILEAHRPRDRRDLGRNDRCWCGSGRKYKQCHQGREVLPLEDRAGWLYDKAVVHVHEGPWRHGLIDVAQARAAAWDFDGALLAALRDPLVLDAVLFEGGAFEEFVAERGDLLPEDERILADQWLLVDRSVFEVEHVHRDDEGVDLRDLRTGDRHRVRKRSATRELHDGDLICARVVPAGETMQFLGGIELVTLRERDGLLALLDTGPSPVELVELLSARFAPPMLQNTEGEDLVACEITLDLHDPSKVTAGLTARYASADTEPDGSRRWIEHVTTMGMERIRATFDLVGSTLRIDTNSNERAERALAVVLELDPDAVLTSDDRTPVDQLAEAADRAGDDTSKIETVDMHDPAMVEALAELLRKQEAAWLDDPIAALAGLTPRQAADDPTRRPDLEHLLDSHDTRSGVGTITMNTERLRTALGLPTRTDDAPTND